MLPVVPEMFVPEMLVEVSEVITPFVEVRLVKTPVLGVVAPIEELLIGELVMVPPLMVSESTTMPSVILLPGKVIEPVATKLVEVSEVKVPLVELKLLVPRLVVKKLVVVRDVPFAFVKDNPVEKRLVEVALPSVTLPEEVRLVIVPFVEVKFVKTPVLGVVPPIEVLLIVEFAIDPPSIVKALVTKASVIEFAGRVRPVKTTRLVVVFEPATRFVILALVEVAFVAFTLVELIVSEFKYVIVELLIVVVAKVVLPVTLSPPEMAIVPPLITMSGVPVTEVLFK
jgi:hypothetical protein